jgi:uncharacterized protein YpmB
MWKRLNKKISTSIAIEVIFILVITVAGFTCWQYGEIRKEENQMPEVQIPEKRETAGSSSEFSATEGWNIYRNEEYGFEVKYPKDWEIENKEIKNPISGSYLSINQLENMQNLNLDEWFNENTIVDGRPTLLRSSESTVINGVKAKILNSDLNPPNPLWHVHIADKNNRIFSLYAYSSTTIDINIFNQMLSTFRFIK